MWNELCDRVQLERPTLEKFLLYHTKTGELCVITESGYTVETVYIDHEDLFVSGLSERYRSREVTGDRWGYLDITTPMKNIDNDDVFVKTRVTAHFIEVGDAR